MNTEAECEKRNIDKYLEAFEKDVEDKIIICFASSLIQIYFIMFAKTSTPNNSI